MRTLYAEAIRESGLGFAGRAGLQVATQRAKGDQALAAEMVAGMRREIGRLGEPETLARLADAAELLAGARRIYCLGLRACYPVAWNMNYVLSLLGDRAVLVDAAGNIGTDRIGAADAADVLLAASVEPYTRATIETATHAADQGVPIVAITDSHLSPLARLAREVILVSTEAPSFFHSMTPGFAAAEILAALVAGRGAEQSLAAIRRTEAHLAAFNVHWQNSESRRSR